MTGTPVEIPQIIPETELEQQRLMRIKTQTTQSTFGGK
jgi:hypothetical protein